MNQKPKTKTFYYKTNNDKHTFSHGYDVEPGKCMLKLKYQSAAAAKQTGGWRWMLYMHNPASHKWDLWTYGPTKKHIMDYVKWEFGGYKLMTPEEKFLIIL